MTLKGRRPRLQTRSAVVATLSSWPRLEAPPMLEIGSAKRLQQLQDLMPPANWSLPRCRPRIQQRAKLANSPRLGLDCPNHYDLRNLRSVLVLHPSGRGFGVWPGAHSFSDRGQAVAVPFHQLVAGEHITRAPSLISEDCDSCTGLWMCGQQPGIALRYLSSAAPGHRANRAHSHAFEAS
jgi:hypothetical protein